MARLTDAETSDDATQAIWKELAEAGAERSVESALNLLESESPAERQAGMITIVAFAIRCALDVEQLDALRPRMEEALWDEFPPVRAGATLLLFKTWIGRAGLSVSSETVARLVELARSPIPGDCGPAALALASIRSERDRFLPELREAASKPEPTPLLVAAVLSFYAVADEASIDIALASLSHPDAAARHSAAGYFAEVAPKGSASLPRLVEILHDESEDSSVRETAFYAISRFAPEADVAERALATALELDVFAVDGGWLHAIGRVAERMPDSVATADAYDFAASSEDGSLAPAARCVQARICLARGRTNELGLLIGRIDEDVRKEVEELEAWFPSISNYFDHAVLEAAIDLHLGGASGLPIDLLTLTLEDMASAAVETDDAGWFDWATEQLDRIRSRDEWSGR
ncbi:MAG: hypothetical protein KDB80_09595 [Planctomycetes bacterium]|nr:hypothetical protein [Planctomycetota bacterium]